jgi:hypothetical protein
VSSSSSRWYSAPQIVGAFWSSTHTEHPAHMAGADLVVSYLGSIVSWPVLLFADVHMT